MQARPLETGRPQWPAGYPAPQGKRPESPQSPGRGFVAQSGNAGLVAVRTFERQVVELPIRAALLNRFKQLGRPQTVVVATVA